jgi:hypothetical protein
MKLMDIQKYAGKQKIYNMHAKVSKMKDYELFEQLNRYHQTDELITRTKRQQTNSIDISVST